MPAAIACADGGDVARAKEYLARSEQVAGAFFPQSGWQAGLDEIRGHIALANGDVEAGGRLLSAAQDGFEQFGQRLDATRCRDRLEAVAGAGKV